MPTGNLLITVDTAPTPTERLVTTYSLDLLFQQQVPCVHGTTQKTDGSYNEPCPQEATHEVTAQCRVESEHRERGTLCTDHTLYWQRIFATMGIQCKHCGALGDFTVRPL